MGQDEGALGYRRLDLFQKADELVLVVYKATRNFPPEEMFGLTSQMRRCAVSVPANIVEGYGRRTEKDTLRFCYTARGSLNELEYYIDLVYRLGYISEEQYTHLRKIRDDVGRLLLGFIRSLNA